MGARINITFPVLNEEAQLEKSVEQTIAFCRANGIDSYEIIVADNGSADRTEAIGRALAARHPAVRYLRLPVRGFGLALKTSWGQSQADFVGYMDVDLATDLRHLKEVYDRIGRGGYDLYMGSRLKRGARVTKRTPLRAFLSRVLNVMLRTRLRVSFSDAMCGFKFIDRKLYESLAAKHAFTDDWFFVAQLVVRADWAGARILDMPVVWTDQPNSKSGARLVNLSKLYLAGISELKRERRGLRRAKAETAR